MNNYNLILLSCVGDSEFRKWTSKPFAIDGVAYSTDASIMAMIPANLTENIGPLEGYEADKFLTVIPRLRLHKMSFSVLELLNAIALCPMVPDKVECEACEGEGLVEYEYYFDNKNYCEELGCPVCNGEGELKKGDNKILDPDKRIKIGDSYFAFPYIQKIADAAKLLEVENIDLALQEPISGKSIFRFDHVEILLMPCIPDEDYETLYQIN